MALQAFQLYVLVCRGTLLRCCSGASYTNPRKPFLFHGYIRYRFGNADRNLRFYL